jgi:predicted dehydrogenase
MITPAHTVGIIGLGFGRAHVPAFQAAGCRVVAVCQRDQAAAKAVADRYGVPQVFARWEEMLERAKPEIVVIATPPHLHHTIALRAFAQGAHVLCEKPVAMTAAEARAMVDAAARAGRVAMTCFNWRCTPAMQELHARVADGALGRPLHLALRWLAGRWADEGVAATWRMDRAQAGHGVMGDMGVHQIDLVRWSFGEFRRVAAHAGIAYPSRSAPGVSRPPDAEDYCTVLGELDSGAQVTLTASRVAHGANEHTLEAYGTRGAVRYRLAREGARWYEGELQASVGGGGFQPVAPRAAVPPGAGEGDQLDVMGKATIGPLVRHLLDAIRTGAAPSPSLADGLAAQAVLDAVLASVARGGWVEVAR